MNRTGRLPNTITTTTSQRENGEGESWETWFFYISFYCPVLSYLSYLLCCRFMCVFNHLFYYYDGMGWDGQMGDGEIIREGKG